MEKDLKIAIVTDPLKVYGGLERHLEGVINTFPKSVIFTPYFKKEVFPKSFLKYDIRVSKHPNLLANLKYISIPFLPIIFENFDLSDFDLVISMGAGFSKCISFKKIHIAYVLTPPRFLWNLANSTQDRIKSKLPLYIINNYLRVKDFTSAQNPSYIFVNSEVVKKRVEKFYRRDSTVIYPFVDTELFKMNNNFSYEGNFLIISRLEKYKNIDLAISVFNKLKIKLDIIGEGSYRKELEKIADKRYINFLGYVKDSYLIDKINESKALIFPGAEDFGLTPIEALACGKAVIGYNKDGVKETIIDKKTGYLFNSRDELEKIVRNFNAQSISKEDCRERAEKFSKENFHLNLRKNVFNIIEKNGI